MNPKLPGSDDTEETGNTSSVTDSAQPTHEQASNGNDVDASNQADGGDETPQTDQPAAEETVEQDAQATTVDESTPAEPVQETETAEAPDIAEPVQEIESAEAPAADTADEDSATPDTPPARRLKRGDVIEGTVKETSPTQVTVDIGEDIVGVIPGHELDKMTKSTLESLKEGEKVMVFVVNPNNHDGNVLLSVNLALEELDWKRAEEYRQSQDVFESRVAGYNRGGLIVRFGRVRGFVPQSQMGADRRRAISGETPEERWGGMVGDPITVKVMEVDRQRNRLILSERSATRESREKRKETLIKELTVGEVRQGRVVSLEDFGAFVDIGGAEGLVHLTELSWQHVTHPRELLNVGQEVQVEVINIDQDAKRIGLSLKSQEPDPWDVIATTFSVGQLVKGTVTKLTKFGAFAQLEEVKEIEGLIHISELSERRVNHPREVVNEGDVLTLRVVKMDIRNRRLGLSLKKVNSPEYLDQDWSADLE